MNDTDRPADSEQVADAKPEAQSAPLSTAELRDALSEANRQSEEYLDLLRRARADFSNFKRRTDEQRAEQTMQARAETLIKILPIVDDFRRAISNPPTDGVAAEWAQGVLLIERKLRALLEGEGLVRIEAEGAEFNPWEHEAISYQTSPELEDGKVLVVARDGYRLGDRVIRPAQVVVARRG
jgi:molecular chaperone GrpE